MEAVMMPNAKQRGSSPPTRGHFLDHFAQADARDGAAEQQTPPVAVGVPVFPGQSSSSRPPSSRPGTSHPPEATAAVATGAVPIDVPAFFSPEGPHTATTTTRATMLPPTATPSAISTPMEAQVEAEMAELRARVARAEALAAQATELAAAEQARDEARREREAAEKGREEARRQRQAAEAAWEEARRQREVAEAKTREEARRRAAEEERRRVEAAREAAREAAEEEERRRARGQAALHERLSQSETVRAPVATRVGSAPPSGKWVGTGLNQQNGLAYRINFYLRFEDGDVSGVAVPPNAFQGFARVHFAGTLDTSDNTCRLDHTRQSGWTKCRFRRCGDEWVAQCEWNMANLTGWYGTHELTFSGDTRTRPGGMSLF